jgi:hypothetical protein
MLPRDYLRSGRKHVQNSLCYFQQKLSLGKKTLAQRNNKITRWISLTLRKSIPILHLSGAQRKCPVMSVLLPLFYPHTPKEEKNGKKKS